MYSKWDLTRARPRSTKRGFVLSSWSLSWTHKLAPSLWCADSCWNEPAGGLDENRQGLGGLGGLGFRDREGRDIEWEDRDPRVYRTTAESAGRNGRV
eukprot:363340-Chlamydomonas_euryale.AAC.12